MDYNLCAPQGNGNIGNLQTTRISFSTSRTETTQGFIAVNDNTIMCVSSVTPGQPFFGIQSSKCIYVHLFKYVIYAV